MGRLRDLAEDLVLVAAASEAGIFLALQSEPATASELSASLDFDLRATTIVLRALESAGMLSSEDGRYALTEYCSRFLGDPEGTEYAGRGLPHWLRGLRARSRLGEVLERGGPLEPRPPARSPAKVARFTAAMAAAPPERLERIVEICLARAPHAASVLDLGGGTGHLIRRFVERGLSGVLVDVPEIVAHVEDAYGLRAIEGLRLVASDITSDPIPSGPFDVVVVANVLHIYGPDTVRRVIATAASALAPGGVLAVAEWLRGRSPGAESMALRMLIDSDEGEAYSEEEMRAWMSAAGLVAVEVVDLDARRQLVTAVRPTTALE